MVGSADALVPGAVIQLLGGSMPVTVVQAEGTASGQFWTVVYRDSTVGSAR